MPDPAADYRHVFREAAHGLVFITLLGGPSAREAGKDAMGAATRYIEAFGTLPTSKPGDAIGNCGKTVFIGSSSKTRLSSSDTALCGMTLDSRKLGRKCS
jgi:hypothetical protein